MNRNNLNSRLIFAAVGVMAVIAARCTKAEFSIDADADALTDDTDAEAGMDDGDATDHVGCVQASDCPGDDGPCRTRMCTDGSCGVTLKPQGTVISQQTNGNCHVNRCDDAGNVVLEINNANVPNDGKQCTRDVCQAGVPSNPPVQPGTMCTDNGGDHCSAVGECIISQSFFVVRVGDGMAPLTSAATPVFLEEQQVDGTVLRVIPIATTTMGTNHRFSDSGIAKSDGALARSANGHYVTLAGYDAAVGTPSIVRSAVAAVSRVVARVDAAGRVDTSTVLTNAFDGDNVRSAVTTDGTAFWVAGQNSNGSGIVQVPLGGTTGTTILSNLPNVRVVQIADGLLYGTGASAPYNTVFTVGFVLPTAVVAAASLPGAFAASETPYGFVLLDLSANIPGPDTLYVADERPTAMGGGIQKWKFDGKMWTLATTFGTTGFRSLAGIIKGPNVWLLGSTADPNGANNLVVFVDSGDAVPVSFPGAMVDGTTKVFRGVAVSPQ